jgi:hypothetical protein
MTYFSRVLAAIILLFGFSNTTFAQANISFSPREGEFFEFTLDENETIKDYAVITNGSDKEQFIIVTAVDGTLTQQGHFALESLDRSRDDIGAWTELEAAQYTIPSMGSVSVPFSLTIPSGTTPGEYTGGLLVTGDTSKSNVNASAGGNSNMGAAISVSMGTRIYLKVKGDLIMDLSWNEFSSSFEEDSYRYQFANQFTNNGNVQVKLNGDVTISSPLPFFEDVVLPIEDKLVNPDSSIELSGYWTDLPKFGLFKAISSINYEQNMLFTKGDLANDVSATPSERTLSFWIIPTKELLISFAISLICFFVLMYRSRRFQKLLSATQSYQWPTDESLVAIATRYKTDWKLLAKLNKIKSPYMVFTGQTLRLPTPDNTPAPQPSTQQTPAASTVDTNDGVANTQI